MPKLDEVKARVRDDVLKKKAVDRAAPERRDGRREDEVRRFRRGRQGRRRSRSRRPISSRAAPRFPTSAPAPRSTRRRSRLPAGGVSDPIVTDNGAVIVKVLEKKDADRGGAHRPAKEALRTELLNERRNRFYAAYMTKARERMKVTINRELIAQLVT